MWFLKKKHFKHEWKSQIIINICYAGGRSDPHSDLTWVCAHFPRFGGQADPPRQPVSDAAPGWVVCHPCFPLYPSAPLSVSCRGCLLSCSPLWPHLSQMNSAAYSVNLCVRVCFFVCVSKDTPTTHAHAEHINVLWVWVNNVDPTPFPIERCR